MAEALLGKQLRVELSDGRCVIGRFICLDAFGNLVLKDTREAAGDGKQLGITMVPSRHMRKAEVAEAGDG